MDKTSGREAGSRKSGSRRAAGGAARKPRSTPENRILGRSAMVPPDRAHAATDPDAADRRRLRIAEAAYFRAERRGFAPGYEVLDWLEAEAEIDCADDGNRVSERTPPPGG